MFPLSHIYIATKVLERKSALLVLGSVAPDLAWFSLPLRGKIHHSPQEFWDFVKKKYPDFLDLAWGVRLHSQISKGADFYCDDEKIGFAKVNGKKIVPELAKLIKIDNEDQLLVFAHNFIEAAMDVNLSRKFPAITKLYKESIGDRNLEVAALILADFLNEDKALVAQELKNLLHFFGPANLADPEKLTRNTIVVFLEQTLGKKIDYREAFLVLERSRKLIRTSFISFLNQTVKTLKWCLVKEKYVKN